MTTFTALTTILGEDPAYALADDLETLNPEPTGIGVFEIEDGSGLWEVAAYFLERPDAGALAVMCVCQNKSIPIVGTKSHYAELTNDCCSR